MKPGKAMWQEKIAFFARSCLILSTPLLMLPAIASAAPQKAAATWLPVPNGALHWQLQGDVVPAPGTKVIDSDLFDTPAKQVKKWRDQGLYPVCYVNVGAFEDWRDDATDFPDDVIGAVYDGWQGERWLDVTHFTKFASIIDARLDLCAHKGFLAVEPDNIDGYDNETGFDITPDDQVAYLHWLIDQAHKRQLAIGQKNAPDLIDELVGDMDFALLESAWRDDFLSDYIPYRRQNKPVFAVEYREDGASLAAICPDIKQYRFVGMVANYDLAGQVETCP
ncbi:endo alpha-1,4 polygalactosaminidase [Thalassospira sp.]|uniref:endo alpha-1,4 polygalactosaminidase n=1 Tax=Thalassospira sp. TaxID=1912094 RepID=UPI003AA7B5F2